MRKSNSVCAPSRLMAHSHPSCSLLGSAVPSGRLGTCICHLVLPAPNVEHCSLWERASTSDVIPFPENQQVPLSCDLLELVSSHQQSQLATQSALRGHSNPLTPLRMREAEPCGACNLCSHLQLCTPASPFHGMPGLPSWSL